MNTSPSPRARIESLDSVRGLAALAVLFSHFFIAYDLPPFVGMGMVAALWDGFAAVSMFFVLSGFVLSRKFLDPSRQASGVDDSLPPFFCARLFRIVPAYFVAVGLSAVAHRWLFTDWETYPVATDWIRGFWTGSRTVVDLLKESVMLVKANENRLVPQSWTLTIELKFSLLLPFFVLIAKRGASWLIVFTFFSLTFGGAATFLWHFTLGVLLAKLLQQATDRLQKRNLPTKIAVAASGWGLYSANSLIVPMLTPALGKAVSWYLTGLGSAVLILCILSSKRIDRMFGHSALRLLGCISYSFYLVHWIVLMTFTPLAIHACNTVGLRDEWWTRSIALVASVALTTALALALYRWVELPSIAVGKICSRWLALRKQPLGLP